jgi:hypothetical protein
LLLQQLRFGGGQGFDQTDVGEDIEVFGGKSNAPSLSDRARDLSIKVNDRVIEDACFPNLPASHLLPFLHISLPFLDPREGLKFSDCPRRTEPNTVVPKRLPRWSATDRE